MAIPFNSNSVPESSSGLVVNMNDDPGIYWTPEEQATLEYLLTEYTSLSNIPRYAEIAAALNDKTALDVARRVSWMNKKMDSRRRKDDHNLSRKSKAKKERVSGPAAKSSQFSAQPNVPLYPPQMNNGKAVPHAAIGGLCKPRQIINLLGQNKQAFNQIFANLSYLQIRNLNLMSQTRNNIFRIIEGIDSPEVANSILPLPFHQPQ